MDFMTGLRLRESLHYAVLTRNVVSVDEQLQRGADVFALNRDGDTPLHMLGYPSLDRIRHCYSKGGYRVGQSQQSAFNEQEIIRRFVSVDKRCLTARDVRGNTPLMRCVKAHNHVDVVRDLLEQEQLFPGGTDLDNDMVNALRKQARRHFFETYVNVMNHKDESVLDLAFAGGKYEVIEVIFGNLKRVGDLVGAPYSAWQGRIHGPKGVGAEKFRLAPSALAIFCQFYMY